MTDSTALTTQQQPGTDQVMPAQLATIDHEIRQFDFDWRRAKAFSSSRMVPQHFQGKPEDCMVAVMMARQLGVDPLLALQNVQVINGRPGFSASFAIGLANQRGPFAGPITWSSQGQGDSLEVTAKATVRATGEVVSATVSMAMAKAEGWVKNPKYRSIPEQMLRYRSATWLIRLHCPEVLLGLHTDEEVETMTVKVVNNNPAKASDNTESTGSSADVIGELNAAIRQSVPTQDVGQPSIQVQPETEPVDVVEVDDPF